MSVEVLRALEFVFHGHVFSFVLKVDVNGAKKKQKTVEVDKNQQQE